MAKKSGRIGTRGNKTGTLRKKRASAQAPKPGRKKVKGGAGRGAGRGKHAAQDAQSQKRTGTRKAGPKKTPRGTTRRSGER